MANYTAADIKALREKTAAGMMDVKKALDETDGDAAKATELLRVKGLKGVTKREGRSASNGLVRVDVTDGVGTLVEINCETDFVAKGPKFAELADTVLAQAVAIGASTAEELLALTRGDDPDVASEARRLLATRQDAAGLAAVREAWADGSDTERTEMLRELARHPAPEHASLFVEALGSHAPEDVQLGARALGALGDPEQAEQLVSALERGVLSSEYALVEALRRLGSPESLAQVRRILFLAVPEPAVKLVQAGKLDQQVTAQYRDQPPVNQG